MVNYSQLIEGAMVLMYKPSVIDSPSGGVPARVPRWDLVDTEGYGGGNSSFVVASDVFGVRGYI